MKCCKLLSPVFLALTFIGFSCTVGCDAGKPRLSAPVENPPLVVAEEPLKPTPESERELVAIGENASGRADFAKDGDKHIMAPILVPLGQYFTIRDRLPNLQMQHAINLYKAENDNKMPATHDEFMKKIIEANNIGLPPLRNPNDKYQYDPASGELKISTVKQ